VVPQLAFPPLKLPPPLPSPTSFSSFWPDVSMLVEFPHTKFGRVF